MIDDQGVSASLDPFDLGDPRILRLDLVTGLRDRERHGVIAVTRDDEQRAAIGILRIDVGLAAEGVAF